MGISERKEREKQEMRVLITEAALKMYIKEGFEKTSLRHIAQEIEYSPATIYLYFKDKDELFAALHEMAFEKLFEQFAQMALTTPDPLERLRQTAALYLRFSLENPELYELMFIMKEPMKVEINMEEWPCGLKTYEFLKNTLIECMEKGLIRPENPDLLSFSVWSQIHGMISLHLCNRIKMYPKEEHGRLLQEVVEMMFRRYI